MKLLFITTGGTIDKVYFDATSDYEVGASCIDSILKEAKVNIEYSIQSLFRKDSLDITPDDRKKILTTVQKEKNTKIIITHGTDTMIETAKILKQINNKTIILTGAMEPAVFKSSDAVFNLGTAVSAVQILPPGIYIAMSGRIFHPEEVIKNKKLKVFEEKM